VNAYGLSKWQAERALQEQFCDDRMSVVIVRPVLVYGANVKGNLQNLASAVRWGLPRPPAGGGRSMIALEDLVELLCVIAQRPLSLGVHTWIASGIGSYSTQAIYDMLREASGKRRGTRWLPRWVWRVVTRLLDMAHGQGDESTYDKLFGTELYSNAALLRDIDWRPRIKLEDAIGRIATVGNADA
jgi:nucleoside-diphosphate-sugar epimerase